MNLGFGGRNGGCFERELHGQTGHMLIWGGRSKGAGRGVEKRSLPVDGSVVVESRVSLS